MRPKHRRTCWCARCFVFPLGLACLSVDAAPHSPQCAVSYAPPRLSKLASSLVALLSPLAPPPLVAFAHPPRLFPSPPHHHPTPVYFWSVLTLRNPNRRRCRSLWTMTATVHRPRRVRVSRCFDRHLPRVPATLVPAPVPSPPVPRRVPRLWSSSTEACGNASSNRREDRARVAARLV